jgi:hypothetical protein
MAWIEVHQQLVSHPKLLDVADDLEICAPQAIGHLLCLWLWAVEYAPDGDLERFSVRRIEGAAHWTGPAGALVEALQARGWLDGWQIHDWYEYAGKLVERRREDAARKAESRRPGRPPAVTAAAPAEAEDGSVEADEVVPPAGNGVGGGHGRAKGVRKMSGGRPVDVRRMSGGRPADVLRNPTTTTTLQYPTVQDSTGGSPPPPDASETVGGVVVAVEAAFDELELLSKKARREVRAGWLRSTGSDLRPEDVRAWAHYLRRENAGRRNGAVLGPGIAAEALAAGRAAPESCYGAVVESDDRMRYVLQ